MGQNSVKIPTVCTACGHASSSGISLRPGTASIYVGGNRSSCPRCGGVSITPDGLWTVHADASATVQGLKSRSLLNLQRILSQSTEPKKVAKAIKDDPALKDVYDVLAKYGRNSVNASVFLWFLRILVILAIEQAALHVVQGGDSTPTTTRIEADNVVIIEDSKDVTIDLSEDYLEVERPEILPNRNDPCWCGSARRYKRCHRSTDVVAVDRGAR